MSKSICEMFDKWEFGVRIKDKNKLKVASILSEWGCTDETEMGLNEIDYMAKLADSNI